MATGMLFLSVIYPYMAVAVFLMGMIWMGFEYSTEKKRNMLVQGLAIGIFTLTIISGVYLWLSDTSLSYLLWAWGLITLDFHLIIQNTLLEELHLFSLSTSILILPFIMLPLHKRQL